LDSDKESVVDSLFYMNDFDKIFSDIDVLILKNETTRAKHIFSRWLDKITPGEVFSSMRQANEEDTINKLLETWGKYARRFRIVPEKKSFEEKSEENAVAYFYRGWLKEAVNYSGKDQLKYTLENISCFFKTDIEDFLQQVIKRGLTEEIKFILNGKIRIVFSERNKISACAWAVRNCRV